MSVPGSSDGRDHYSVDLCEEHGWVPGKCACGWDGGMFPTAEDAADALMDHARGVGYAEALRDAVAMLPGEQAKP